jgi:ATP-binding cassette subfamily F protein 3
VITGGNGSGKTTFLRTLIGELAPEGELKVSPSMRAGYLPQRTELAPEQMASTPIDLVRRSSTLSETEARRFLHRFLFSGDDARVRVERLSYGEQRRLWLAKLVLAEPNLLVLDEPTNHLDIPSQEAFEETLSSFDGAILTVTHDRYLIEQLGGRVLAIEDGRLREART